MDDDLSITMVWQRILKKYNVKCQYFISKAEFSAWHTQNSSADIILLIDYDFKEEQNGFDILQEYKINNSYMFTSHAEEEWLQNLAAKHNFKLIPKSLINSMNILQA